jgi:hypothetical protein
VRVRELRVRRAEAPGGERRRRRQGARRLGRPRLGHRRVARHALLQQQLRRLHARVLVEARDHHVVLQQVRERHQDHALVVGHVRLHHLAASGLGRPRVLDVGVGPQALGVVDRLVEAVLAREPLALEAVQVRDRRLRVDERRQRRGVGRHHQVVGQAALQAQPGHAEGLVLVVALAVGDRVGGLGDAQGTPSESPYRICRSTAIMHVRSRSVSG